MNRMLKNAAVVAAMGLTLPVWAQTLTIGALVSAQVDTVKVKEGDSVKQGDVLLMLDQATYEARLAIAQSKLDYQQVVFKFDENAYLEAQDLFEQGVTSQRELDEEKLRYEKSLAKFSQAKAQLALVKAKQRYYTITAPQAGVVERISVLPGTTVFKENQSLIELKVD